MSQALTVGSLQQVANQAGQTVAETFLSVDALLVLDISDSMTTKDCPGLQERYAVAVRELRRLQETLPGKLGVIQFNHRAEFIPSGTPDFPSGTTDVAGALEFIKPVDGCGIRIILISDGEPDNGPLALEVARKFKTKIDTVYIGPEMGSGAEFLRRLSALTGGVSENKTTRHLPELAQTVSRLLSA